MNGRLANSQSSPTSRRLLVAIGLALVVLALLPAMALADTHTWMGLGDGYWSTGANWIGGVPPSDGDNIVFPASTATLPGADNRHLPAVAHVHMADASAATRRSPWVEDR